MREKSLYLLFGACTTGISIGSFAIANDIFGINALLANVLSWVLAVSFAYVTNRMWVFQSENRGKALLREILSFFSGRLATLGLEELILLVFATALSWNATWIKAAAQVAVFAGNYCISKWLVFRKKKA